MPVAHASSRRRGVASPCAAGGAIAGNLSGGKIAATCLRAHRSERTEQSWQALAPRSLCHQLDWRLRKNRATTRNRGISGLHDGRVEGCSADVAPVVPPNDCRVHCPELSPVVIWRQVLAGTVLHPHLGNLGFAKQVHPTTHAHLKTNHDACCTPSTNTSQSSSSAKNDKDTKELTTFERNWRMYDNMQAPTHTHTCVHACVHVCIHPLSICHLSVCLRA